MRGLCKVFPSTYLRLRCMALYVFVCELCGLAALSRFWLILISPPACVSIRETCVAFTVVSSKQFGGVVCFQMKFLMSERT